MHKGFGTCDFEPSRLNVYLDKDRLIDKVTFGFCYASSIKKKEIIYSFQWFSKRQNLDIQWISRFSRITAL